MKILSLLPHPDVILESSASSKSSEVKYWNEIKMRVSK